MGTQKNHLNEMVLFEHLKHVFIHLKRFISPNESLANICFPNLISGEGKCITFPEGPVKWSTRLPPTGHGLEPCHAIPTGDMFV